MTDCFIKIGKHDLIIPNISSIEKNYDENDFRIIIHFSGEKIELKYDSMACMLSEHKKIVSAISSYYFHHYH